MSSVSALSVLTNDVPASWIDIPKCPRCQKYFIKTKNDTCPRQPLCLPCSHIICNSCIAFIAKQKKPKCEQCSSKLTFDKSLKWNHQFDYDYHILGFIQFKTYTLPHILKYAASNSNFGQNGSFSKLCASSETKCIECSMSTQYMCVQCSSKPYCKSCFLKVHAMGIVIRTHELVDLNSIPSTIGRILSSCKDHSKMKMDHYCRTCSYPICSLCLGKSHNKHETTKLITKNRNVDLVETSDLLKSAMEKIDKSQKNTSDYINKIDGYATSTAQDIFKYFQHYHAILQNLEKDALIELKKLTVDNIEKIQHVKCTLDQSNDKIKATISRINKFSKEVPNDVNLTTVHNEVLCLLENLPTDFNVEQIDKNPFCFNGTDFKKNNDLKDTCKVVFEKNRFSPRLENIFAEPKSSESSIVTPEKCMMTVASKMKKQSSSITSTAPLIAHPYLSPESTKVSRIKSRVVTVTEMINPKKFYVQNVDFLLNAEDFVEECNQCALNTVKMTDIVINEMVLVYENDQTRWYRGIIREKLLKYIAVFLVDYGRILSVSEKQLRKISDELKKLPAAASVFTVFNIEPKDGEWSDTSVELIGEMTLGNRVTLIHTDSDQQSGDLIVHLDYPTSVQDALLYFSYGVLTDTTSKAINDLHKEISTEKSSFSNMWFIIYIILLLYNIFDIFMVTYIGNEIKTSSDQLSYCLFQSNWIDQSEFCKMYIIILTEVLKQPYELVIGKLYPLNLKTFTTKSVIGNLLREPGFLKQPISQDESFYAKVMNIVSPEELYITKVCRADEILSLSEKVHQFYEKGYHRKIYCPQPDMACCVFTSGRWNRASIVKLHPNLIVDVYLVDIGAHCKVEWRYIRMLEQQFMILPEGVSKCALVDIAPKSFKKKWDPEATVELKRLCKNELKVFVCEFTSRSIAIELYIVKKKVDFLINAYLARYNFVEWVGDTAMTVDHVHESNEDLKDVSSMCTPATITKNASHREFRQMVKIVGIISPSEFYVTLVKHQKAIEMMHSQIQKSMAENNDEKDNVWNVGDHCLVNVIILKNTKKYWYRGRIKSIDNNSYTVFLRDHGIFVSVMLWDLVHIKHYYDNVLDGATKCHLANLRPTSTDWAKAAIDEFKYMTASGENYDGFAVSVHGKMHEHSMPVYLWGQKKSHHDPLAGASISWKNLNEIFASSGYADCLEAFKTIVECDLIDNQIKDNDMTDFNTWSKKIVKSHIEQHTDNGKHGILQNDDDFILEAELDPNYENYCKNKVTAWQPAEPIQKYVFTAIPTYVDNNAIIYLHASSQEQYLQHMKYTINKQIENIECDSSHRWKVDEPCLVRFHSDKCFYRGLIKEVMVNKKFKVEFVDYGNIEVCERSDLRIANILGNIPIQATKYYLAYLKPISDDGIWDRKILEFIHVTIVNKLVSVRVEDRVGEDYIPCSITVGPITLNKLLIAEKLADHTADIDVRLKLSETYDFYEGNDSTTNRDQDKYRESMPLEKFQEIIAKKNEVKKHKEYVDQFNLDMSADLVLEEDSDDDVKRNQNFSGVYLQSDIEEFDPVETSTVISKLNHSEVSQKSFSLLPFLPMKLTKEMTKFPCKIVCILDSMHITVEPIIEQFVTEFKAMEKKIKRSSHQSKDNFNFKENCACLARYSKDSFYYRALIKKPNYSNNEALVLFVDYLEEQIVQHKNIRKCPDDVIRQPLKHLIVKLHGINPTRRIREEDIKSQLEENLIDKMAFAVIVKNDKIPSVHLFDKENPDVLIYQSLIDWNFLTKI